MKSLFLLLAACLVRAVAKFEFPDLEVYSRDETVIDLNEKSGVDDATFAVPSVPFLRLETTFSQNGAESALPFERCRNWIPGLHDREFIFLCDERHLLKVLFDWTTQQTRGAPATQSLPQNLTCGPMFVSKPQASREFYVGCLDSEKRHVLLTVRAADLALLQETASRSGGPQRQTYLLRVSAGEHPQTQETRLYLYQQDDPALEFSFFLRAPGAEVEFVESYSLDAHNLINCGQDLKLAGIINTRPDKNPRLFILLQNDQKLLLHSLARNPVRHWFECSEAPMKEIEKLAPAPALVKYLPMDSLFSDVIVAAFPGYLQLVQVGSRGEIDVEIGTVDLQRYDIGQVLDVFYFSLNYYLVARTNTGRLLVVVHRRAYTTKQTEAQEFDSALHGGFLVPSILDVGTADLFLLGAGRVTVVRVRNNNLVVNFSDYTDSTAKVSVTLHGHAVEPAKQTMTAYVFQSFEDLKNEEMPAVVHLFENTRDFLLPSPFRGLMMSAGELKLVRNSLEGTVKVDFRLPRTLKINFLIDVKGRWLSHFDSLVAINKNVRMAKCLRDIVFVECFEDEAEYNCLSLSSYEMDTEDYQLLEGFLFQNHYYIFAKMRNPSRTLEGIRVFKLDSRKQSELVQTEFYPHDSLLVDIRAAYGDSGFVFLVVAKTEAGTYGLFGLSVVSGRNLPEELLLVKELPGYICPRRISIRDSEFVLTLDVASKCEGAPHVVYHFSLSITRDSFNMTSLKSSHRAVLDQDFELCSQKNVMAQLYMAEPALFIHQANIVSANRDAKTLAFPFGEGNTRAFIDFQCIESEQIVQILARSIKDNTALVTVKMDRFNCTEDRIYSVVILPPHINRISTIVDYHDNGTIREFATIGLADSGKLNESVMIDVKDTWFQPFVTTGKIAGSARGELEFEYSFQRNETKQKRVRVELNENVVYAQPVQRSKAREVLPAGADSFDLEALLSVKGHYVRSALGEGAGSLALSDRFSPADLYESLPYKFNSLIIHHQLFFGATDRDAILMSGNFVLFKESCRATNLRMILSADNTPTFFATFESLKQTTLTNLLVIFRNTTEKLWHREVLPLPFRDITSFRVSSWDSERTEFIFVAQAESLGARQLECTVITIRNNSLQVVEGPLGIPFFQQVIDFTAVPVHNRSLVLVVSLSKARELEFIYLFKQPADGQALRFRRHRYLPTSDYLGNITRIAASRLDETRCAIYSLVAPESSSVFYAFRFELDLALDSPAVVRASFVENKLAAVDGFEPKHMIIHDRLAIIFYKNTLQKNSTLLHREDQVIAVYDMFDSEFAVKVFCSSNLDPGATSLDGTSLRSPSRFVASFSDPPSRFVFDADDRTEVLGFMVNDLQTRLRTFATFNINNLSLEVLSSFKVNETLKKAVLYVYDIDYKPHKLPLEKLFQTSPNQDLSGLGGHFIVVAIGTAAFLLLGVAGLVFWKRSQQNRRRKLVDSGRLTEATLEEDIGTGDNSSTNRTLRAGTRLEEQDTAHQIKL